MRTKRREIEYQSTPCANGRSISGKVAEPYVADPSSRPAAPSARKQCVGKELRINFSDMPLKATLQVLADFSGNKLVADPSVSGSGAFSYECTPWDAVLQDIASRHNLIVKVEGGTIFARRR
jgi:type IV pilus assembly protein PilQ